MSVALTGYTLASVLILAEDAPRNTGPDFGKASPFGLIVVVLLLIGTFLLVRSMNRHLRKLPESFDPEHRDEAGAQNSAEPDPGADQGGSPREPGG